MRHQQTSPSQCSAAAAAAAASPARRLRPRRLALPSLVLLVLAICGLLAVPAPVAAAKEPSVQVNRFVTLPSRVSYFEDSTVVLWHSREEGNVWRSDDEGKSWSPVSGPDKGEMDQLIQHPYDKSTAFILTQHKEHWRTIDRGKTWQKFKTPESPAERSIPLEFNADSKHWDHIIFIGKKCKGNEWFGLRVCRDEAYVTLDGFASDPKPMYEYIEHCMWAKATPEMEIPADRLKRVLCIGVSDATEEGGRVARRLYYSDDFFTSHKLVTLDAGRDPKDFIGIGPSKRYLITALRDHASRSGRAGGGSSTVLFVSTDGEKWQKARFPHGNEIRESGYTVVSATDHSLVVDVKEKDIASGHSFGSLFTSSSDGVEFVKSLDFTHQNKHGIVDYEHLENVDGVMLANVEASKDKLQSRISFDDGSRWSRIKVDRFDGQTCNVDDLEKCSLHLHSVSHLHNLGKVFSSTAPGLVMGVGSVGTYRKSYEECDTWLSVDAGKTWKMVSQDAHKYEFGDQGSILVMAPDEESTDHVKYSWDFGKTWQKLSLGVTTRVKFLTTVPDNTSQKFLLVGLQARQHGNNQHQERVVSIFLDFATQGKRQCGKADFEKWYATTQTDKCLMGHKQWYMRRKATADCYVGHKFDDPVGHEDPCECTDHDFECDFGYVADSTGKCVPHGDVPLPPGACVSKTDTYLASSGYRKIPGNTCKGGVDLAEKVRKSCGDIKPPSGQISTQRFELPAEVVDSVWMQDSPTLLVQLADGSIWMSPNEGLSWKQSTTDMSKTPADSVFLRIMPSPYEPKRAYLVTAGQIVHYTADGGRTWQWFSVPLATNTFGIPALDFHPNNPDWLIWTGSRNCDDARATDCHAEAYYTTDHGRNWKRVENYVRTCSWLRDTKLRLDPKTIVCESYSQKTGSQRAPNAGNKLQIVLGESFYSKQTTLFDDAIAFATFDEYFVVAKLLTSSMTIRFEVSLNGRDWAEAQFPDGTSIEHKAYTALDSSTDAIFLHVTTSSKKGAEYGTLFKSNSNGTFFGTSIEQVNRNSAGFVDFEKMLGLNGVSILNVVTNANEAAVSGVKSLQSRITHNDGGRWKPIPQPALDSNERPFSCNEVGCSLHLHGYTQRDPTSSLFSSPSAIGQMVGVGNVGKKLLPYTESDTFFTRDGGFSWREIRKGAHKWEFGDSGSIIILTDDEDPTDHFVYSLDDGHTWKTQTFGDKLRITAIVTGPYDKRRRFVLLGNPVHSSSHTTAISVDFTEVHQRQCQLLENDAINSDFELWSPAEQRDEKCLFGQQVYYWRRKPRAECYVGSLEIEKLGRVTKTCACTDDDFECNFNHYRDDLGRCVPVSGTSLIPARAEDQCSASTDGNWYDSTAYRKVPMSQCEGGKRPDRGTAHSCGPSFAGHGFFWWVTVIFGPFVLAGLVIYWWIVKGKAGSAGSIRLPGGTTVNARDWTVSETLSSVPYFVLGALGELKTLAQDLLERVPFINNRLRRSRGSYGGYRSVTTDEDAAILRDYDDDEL